MISPTGAMMLSKIKKLQLFYQVGMASFHIEDPTTYKAVFLFISTQLFAEFDIEKYIFFSPSNMFSLRSILNQKIIEQLIK